MTFHYHWPCRLFTMAALRAGRGDKPVTDRTWRGVEKTTGVETGVETGVDTGVELLRETRGQKREEERSSEAAKTTPERYA